MDRYFKCFLLIAVVALLSCPGCGPTNPKTIPVSGQVTFNGGEFPGAGKVNFLPRPGSGTDAEPMRPAIGRFDADGKFQATTWEEGDGLRPGEYLVTVECWKQAPTMGHLGISYVNLKFLRPMESELTVEVKPDDPKVEVTWDVTGPTNPIDMGDSPMAGGMDMNQPPPEE